MGTCVGATRIDTKFPVNTIHPNPMAFDAAKDFKPGEKCEASGIYLVTHDRNHVPPHEVTVVLGEPFPPCRGCGQQPRFRAARLALHISNDPNLKNLPREHDPFGQHSATE
jgi:hypothetical protein